MTKLADWMHKHHVTPEQLRRMLGVRSRTTVLRYLSGDQFPEPRLLDRIVALTGGAVTREDFEDPSPPRCAGVIMSLSGEPRLVFPWSRYGRSANSLTTAVRMEPAEGSGFTPNLTAAIETLGTRVRITKDETFYLDDRLSDPRRIVREANRVREKAGVPLIVYPGVKAPDA